MEQNEVYERPTITEIGDLRELTEVNKCSGSADIAFPTLLDPFSNDGCPPSP